MSFTEQRATSSKLRAAEEATLADVDAILLASDIPPLKESVFRAQRMSHCCLSPGPSLIWPISGDPESATI